LFLFRYCAHISSNLLNLFKAQNSIILNPEPLEVNIVRDPRFLRERVTRKGHLDTKSCVNEAERKVHVFFSRGGGVSHIRGGGG
jgi:hypothetical protein